MRDLSDLLRDAVRRVPESVVLFHGQETWSYARLGAAVERCAAGLSAAGIGRGDTFGIALRNCPEFVVLSFALARLGAVGVPVNFLERGDRIGYIFKDASVKGCLTSPEFLAAVREARAACPARPAVYVTRPAGDLPLFESLLASPGPAPESGPGPDALALLIYTAGTTGLPKGVMLTHGNLLANVESCREAIRVDASDRFLCLLPMFHSFCWTVNVLLPIRLDSSLVIVESIRPFEPVLRAVRERKVTVFCAVPPVFAALVQRMRGLRALAVRWVNPVRVAVSGAAALPPEVQAGFERAFHIPLLEGYGLTEASPVVAVNRMDRPRRPGTVGPAVPGVELKIVDEQESSVAAGQVGEICVRGKNVMAGYYGQPEETRAAFTPDGWLKTGDLGRLDADGVLTIVDRKKDLILVKGLNVYPQEIEVVLLAHPAVAEAAVVGVPDETGDEIPVAYVAVKEGKTADEADLSTHCRRRLAPYKVPREFVVRDALPKNAVGKVLKRELRDEARARRTA